MSIASLTSLTPDETADSCIKSKSINFDIISASVVLPTPGGPQRIIETIDLLSSINLIGLPLPIKCSCPKNPSRVSGLSLSASGLPESVLLTSNNSILKLFKQIN